MPDPKQPNEPEREWRGDDEQPTDDHAFHDEERLAEEDELDIAEEALLDMQAREKRRDQYFRVGGDDYSPGIDTDIDRNGTKELDKD
jgi:hypothetical protein